MKTLIKTTALIITLTILFSTTAVASIFSPSEGVFINNEPNTSEEIYSDFTTENSLLEFTFEEEEYIDDIPFDTRCISINCLYQAAISIDFTIEEEEYIDDIPFNTTYASDDSSYNKAIKVEFNFEEEQDIDDMDIK